MANLWEQAAASVAALPEADQERIGQRLLDHVSTLKALRAELMKAVRSLDAGEGRSLDPNKFLRRARDPDGKR
jgi:hypothetical protein